MSYPVDDCYDSYEEIPRKARKEHKCDACKELIPVGVTYTRVYTLYDGQKETIKRCVRCQMMHEHLRKRGRPDDMYPDEKLNCGESYQDHWEEDPPDDIAALAFLLPGETAIGVKQTTRKNET